MNYDNININKFQINGYCIIDLFNVHEVDYIINKINNYYKNISKLK